MLFGSPDWDDHTQIRLNGRLDFHPGQFGHVAPGQIGRICR
jgi:hypothetical protein